MATILESSYKALTAAVETQQPPLGGFSRFFGNVDVAYTNVIELDSKYMKARVASFVNPDAVADGSEKPTFTRSPFILPTIQDVQTITGKDLGNIDFGESQSLSETLITRLVRRVGAINMDQRTMVRNRIELSAIQIAFNGKLTVSGKGENRIIDFGRDASLYVDVGAVDATQYWNNAGAASITHIEDMLDAMTKFGKTGQVMVGRPALINALLDTTAVQNKRDSVGANVVNEEFRQLVEPLGMRFRGRVADLDVYSYSGHYYDAAGTAQMAMPADKVVIATPVNQNVMQYGLAPIIPQVDGVQTPFQPVVDSENFITNVYPGRREIQVEAIQTVCPMEADVGSFGVLKVIA